MTLRIGLLSTIQAPFLGYIVRELAHLGISIDAVFLDMKPQTEKDRAIYEERTAGQLPPLGLEQFESLKIPFYIVSNHSSLACANLVRGLELDLLVNAGTPRILKPVILEAPTVGVLNCHPGLLPKFRGCTCVEWAIYLDEPVGNTVHFMNVAIDEGPIIIQEGVPIGKADSYAEVRVKVYQHACALLARGVQKVVMDELSPARMLPQGPGQYFGVIDQNKMACVVKKLERGEYSFQK